MVEKIDAVGNDIEERFVLSAISQIINTGSRGIIMNKGRHVEVQLLINGEEVSFTQVVNQWWSQVNRMINDKAAKIAKQMVTDAGLDPVAEALQNAETIIKNALHKVNIEQKLNVDVWDE